MTASQIGCLVAGMGLGVVAGSWSTRGGDALCAAGFAILAVVYVCLGVIK